MIDTTAEVALRKVLKALDKKADETHDMISEGIRDTQSTMTPEHAASYLEDLLVELSTEIGQVIASLEEVSPLNESQAVV